MKIKKGKDAKPHIGIFGRRNTGKSTFINLLVGQEVAIVSDMPGTTTDPVKKSFEIFGIGPAVIIDTAGIDDIGEIGAKRIEKSLEALKTIDLGILMIAGNEFDSYEVNLIRDFSDWGVPFLVIHSKSDLEPVNEIVIDEIRKLTKSEIHNFSSNGKYELEPIIEGMKRTIPETIFKKRSLLGSILGKNDHALLVTPIDKEAPEGRMILPQVMAIRDVLDNESINIVLRETQLEEYLANNPVKPKIVITDSQAFEYVKKVVPEDIMLTGFSVLFAHYKGEFDDYLDGTRAIDKLNDGDRVLLLESCTHQVNCDDIGRYKIPAWLEEHTGKELEFDVVSGLNKVVRDMEDYSLVIQCGGCMVTSKQIKNRLRPAIMRGIPVTNYGMTIAWVNGIFDRATAPFMKNTQIEA